MKSLLIPNIAQLVQVEQTPRDAVRGADMAQLPIMEHCYLLAQGDKIKAFGPMSEAPATADSVIDAQGGMVLPSYCDGHTHIVYAGSREHEFIDKIRGLSYEEIAKRGGGILNSAKRRNETPEDELYQQEEARTAEMISLGTGPGENTR